MVPDVLHEKFEIYLVESSLLVEFVERAPKMMLLWRQQLQTLMMVPKNALTDCFAADERCDGCSVNNWSNHRIVYALTVK